MGKGTITTHIGYARYTVTLNFHGAARVQKLIDELEDQIEKLQNQINDLPDGEQKDILSLKKKALEKQVLWYNRYMPEDETANLWCVDRTEDLSGIVGTIEIPGERQTVLIRPGYSDDAAYNNDRDGILQSPITSSPAATFLNLSVFPGWQKYKPNYRIGTIVAGSIDFENNKCSVCIDPVFSSQNNLYINQDADWSQCEASVHPGFTQFCQDNPSHPVCTNTDQGSLFNITNSQYNELDYFNSKVNGEHEYQTDASGYSIGEYWKIMGPGEKGDCEDFVLTKMDELINAGWSPSRLKIGLCYTELGEGHAVLIVKTTNRGNIVLDNRYNEIINQNSLPYSWFSIQLAGQEWAYHSVMLQNIPIEYMNCHAYAFADGDRVIVELNDKDWDDPKVIGFLSNPQPCEGLIYCGYGAHNPPVSPLIAYNFISNTWIERTASNLLYEGGSYSWQEIDAVNYQLYGFFFGGWFGTFDYIDYVENYVNAYNTGTDVSQWINYYLGNQRSSPAVFAISNLAFIVGGTEFPKGDVREWRDHRTVYDDVTRYNMTNTVGQIMNTFTYPVWQAACFIAGGKGYVTGGNQAQVKETKQLENRCVEYNQEIDSWTYKASFPTVRWYHQAFDANGYGCIIAGQKANPLDYLITGYKFNHLTDTWSQIANLPSEYNQYGAGSQKGQAGKGFVFETSHPYFGDFDSNMIIYDPGTDSWSRSIGTYESMGKYYAGAHGASFSV